jgi:hypothetical protein
MRNQSLILLSLAVLLLSPSYATGDCIDLSRFTNWVREDEHTVTFYRREIPIARVSIPYCEILPSSIIRLRTSYVCDSDSIEVDDNACSIMTVTGLD